MENIFGSTVAAKLTPVLLDRINSTYKEITGTEQKLTFREYFEIIFNRAIENNQGKPLTDEKGQPVNQEQLNEIIAVRDSLHEQLTEVRHQLLSLQTSLTTAETNLQASKLNDNQIIITLEDIEIYFVNELAKLETRRVKKEISPAAILKSLFMHQLFYGAGDWLPKIYSNSEIKAVATRLKAQAAAQATQPPAAETPAPDPEPEPQPEEQPETETPQIDE